jgi:hypothetical protein
MQNTEDVLRRLERTKTFVLFLFILKNDADSWVHWFSRFRSQTGFK